MVISIPTILNELLRRFYSSAGSYEVWVPIEYVGEVMSYMMLHRGENSILFHPLTQHSVEDHTGRTMFLGPAFNIDR